MFPPKPLDNLSPEGGCSEGLDAFRFFLNRTRYNVREKPAVIMYTYITLIAMQGHQTKSKKKTETMYYIIKYVEIIYCYIG